MSYYDLRNLQLSVNEKLFSVNTHASEHRSMLRPQIAAMFYIDIQIYRPDKLHLSLSLSLSPSLAFLIL